MQKRVINALIILLYVSDLHCAGTPQRRQQSAASRHRAARFSRAPIVRTPGVQPSDAAGDKEAKTYAALVKEGKVTKLPVAEQAEQDTCGIEVLKNGRVTLLWAQGFIDRQDLTTILTAKPTEEQLGCKIGKGMDIAELYKAVSSGKFKPLSPENFIALQTIDSFDPSAFASLSSDNTINAFLKLVKAVQEGAKGPEAYALVALGDSMHWIGVVVAKKDKTKAKYYVFDSLRSSHRAEQYVPALIKILEEGDYDTMASVMQAEQKRSQGSQLELTPEEIEFLS